MTSEWPTWATGIPSERGPNREVRGPSRGLSTNMQVAMRKIAIRALGVLAPVLLGLPGVGQEKPNVRISKPEIESRTAEFHQALLTAAQGQLVSSEDMATVFMRNARMKPPEGFEPSVQELEKASRFAAGGSFAQALAALDAAQRAAMKARRSLVPGEDRERLSRDTAKGPHVRGVVVRPGVARVVLTSGVLSVAAVEGRGLREAQSSLRRAVTSLGRARDPDGAGKALDEVDARVMALRVLLWKEASKRD